MKRLSTSLVSASFLLLTMLVPVRPLTAALTPEARAELTASKAVAPALVEALERQEQVVARIYILAPSRTDKASRLRETRDGGEVSPVVVELAQVLLPGKLDLIRNDFLAGLQGTVDARVVQTLLRDPHVIRIELESLDLDKAPVPELAKMSLIAQTPCVPTSTRACVQGTRFSLQIFFGSSTANVAASSSESAVFWFYSSTNWEVVAKVLNACAINNRFWIFAAGATSTAYTLSVVDTLSGRSASYNGAVLCPIADTGQAGFPGFPCP